MSEKDNNEPKFYIVFLNIIRVGQRIKTEEMNFPLHHITK